MISQELTRTPDTLAHDIDEVLQPLGSQALYGNVEASIDFTDGNAADGEYFAATMTGGNPSGPKPGGDGRDRPGGDKQGAKRPGGNGGPAR